MVLKNKQTKALVLVSVCWLVCIYGLISFKLGLVIDNFDCASLNDLDFHSRSHCSRK